MAIVKTAAAAATTPAVKGTRELKDAKGTEKGATAAAPRKAAAPAKKAAVKTAVAKNPDNQIHSAVKADGTARPVGLDSKTGVHGAWMHIFTMNALIAGGKPQKLHGKLTNKPLTDEQIAEWMYAEFPGRDTAAFKAVSSARIKANNGGFVEVPAKPFERYDAAGVIVAKGKRTGTPVASTKKAVKKAAAK